MAAVELKEFNEQDTDVDVGTAHVIPVMKLEKNMVRAGVSIVVETLRVFG